AYALDPERPEDHRRLLGHLAERGVRPAKVLHALGAAPADDLDAALSRGFLGLLAFARTLGHLLPAHPVELVVVTAGAVAVLGDDLANPEHATLLGLCASLDAEYRTLRCRSVDLDATRPDEAARALLAELGQSAEDEPVAWRGRHRWVREWSPHRLDAPKRAVWRERGTYLITGGLGGLGRALAAHLAARVAARLVLVRRTPLPPRDRWPDLAAGSEAVRAVLELERLGAEVVVEAADVADADRLREVVDRAVRRFGALHGVVHAAGVPGAGLVRDKGRDQALAVLRPKVHGTAALLDALRGVPVDFVALYSSSVVAVPGVGESDYTAANAYLDARAAGGADVPVVSIAWGPWRSDSWQAEVFADAPELGARVRSYRDEFGVTEDEGVELLHRALASGLRQVLVLPEGLAATRRRWAELFTAAPATRPAGQRFARPALRTPYVAPRGEVERHIARVWGEHLGVDRVGVDDRFFELGGNSLLAMTVVARLERELGVELSAPVLFERPTVAELAALLDPAGRAGGQVDEAGARGQDRRRRAAARRRGVRGG
ncbi:SDR family NAD(P)-dependent oxidoreductase, partial [Actinosynnema sp. NPDC059797]